MQWETARNESFTKREVRQVHTISETSHNSWSERQSIDTTNRYGQFVNGAITNGTDPSQETSYSKRKIYMVNGDTTSEGREDRFPYKKRESDVSETGSVQRTYSSGSGTGRKLSGSSVGSTSSGTKISSVTMPIRSASFATRRVSSSSEKPVQASTSSSTEAAPTKPVTLPRTSSLVKQRTPSDPKSGLPEVNVKYNIKMKLGEVKGNGVDGNVYIQLFGSKGNTAKIQLRQAGDEKNRFETDQEYKFMVTTMDIGKVERIKLSHDHMEYGTGLHVKEVEVDVPSYGSHYTFPCNCWLAQDKLSEMTIKDLNSTPTPNKGYTVSVHLGKVLDPYTKLYLQLCGEKEESTKIVLRPSGTATDTFQEGKTYKFSVEMPDIGKVERIRVGHDTYGSGKGIFVDDIEVAPDDEEALYFPCSCWLAEDIGDGKLEREIYPGTRTPQTSESDITHTVSVHLGEVLNPEATLYIYLIGRRGETSKVFLRPEEPLQREKTYKFTLALTVDIGGIEKIRLGQDSRGYGKGLFVESVKVVPTESDPPVMFPCACWLAEDVWDSKTERELLPGKAVKRPENVAYNLTFKTGDMPYAGTDANVTLQLFGDKGQTEKIMLRQESGKTLKRFDRGRTDRFTVQTMDVGKVERIRLSHDNTGPNPEWYLEYLKIDIATRDEKYMFPCNRWLTGDEDRRVEVEVYPVDENAVQEESITVEEATQESAAAPEMAEYQVSFRLGEVLDPYTKLFMVIHGDRGDSEKIYLTPEGGRLEPGKLYTVTVTTTDVGKVRNISMGCDGASPNQGVFVEEVEVTAPSGPPVVFPSRCWLAEDEDDGQTTRVLVPGQSLTSQYDIGFRLGEVLDPNTKLYMVLYGDKGESGKIYLLPDGSKFEPDKFYKVSVNIKDIGNVQKVHIGHDSKGRNKGLFVEEIEVTAPDAPKVIFPCRCWLAENEDDGKTARVIEPGESLTQPYDIAFRLGEVMDPRAKLYMILHGKKGDSGKIYLAPSDGKKFEPGRLYTVSANIRDIGPIEKISLGNESRGPGHGVFVEEVEVAAPNEEPVIFPSRCWLAEDEGDGLAVRVLKPGETMQPTYDILFRLGEVRDPWAKLYMILYGDRGESGKIYLTPSDGTRFEAGKQYRVSVNIKDIGKINKVFLGSDAHGSGRGIYVEEIEVQSTGEDPVIFPCRCWLAEDEGDGKTARVLTPGETIHPQLDSTLYNMTFETEDVPFAGTDATVYVKLFGEKGQTEKIEFRSEDKKEAPKFKRGRIDKFAVETADVGKLTKLRVGHDNTGRNPEWYLKKLSIEIPSRDETYVFEYNNWIAGEEVNLDPIDEKTRTELYTIHLKLGEVADPYAPVWIQLVGEKGESGQIQIKPGYGPNDKFEKGRIYKVVARVADIGRIVDVKVGQDAGHTGIPSKGLYVEEVVVTASRGDGVVFPCHCWTGDEDKIAVEPGLGNEVPLDTTYQVTFKTGDRPNAGTSAKVQFELFGDTGKTEPILLSEDKSLRLFERGNSDKFKVDTRDVGKIEKLRVNHDNSGRDPDWYLEEVTIDVPDKGEQYIFPCHRWLMGSQRNVDLIPAETKDLSQEVDYRIMIKTGDENDAGTDANVNFQMFGKKGKTQNFSLREEGDKKRFEKGRMDKFLIRTRDIGKLTSVRISRDNKGVKPGWLLDKITIDVDEKDEHYVFYCNRWLGGSDIAIDFTPEQGSLPGQEGMYTVSVKVGEVLDPDVNPFYQIVGRNGETNKIRLREGYSRSHVFTKGNTYKVSVKSPDVGEITKLRIGDDGYGRGKTMFVEEVTVTSKEGDTVLFPCRCWLGKDDSNTKIIRELVPGKPVPEELEDISYHMTIKTADVQNAGTDANVYFALHGDKGETPKIALQDESQTFKRFERGRADKFVVQTADVGKLEKLVIGHDNGGEDPGWLLEEVDVDIPVRDEHYKFRCDGWLGGERPGQRKEAVLYPVDDIDGEVKPTVVDDLQETGASGFGDAEYDVEFKTSAEENAGTDANVYFQMIGEDGETQEIDLKNKGKGYFHRGQLDRFRIRARDVGRLKMLRVGHDNSGSNSRWLLDEVVIFSLARGERYVFKGGRWIGGRTNEIDLPLDSWNYGRLVGQEPDIPDLIDYMQSGDEVKIINAAGYLQHLCYSKEYVKDKVRDLGGIPVIVRLLRHSEWRVRYAAVCLLRNLSFSMKNDANRLAIADCGGIEALIEILQETEKTEYREAIVGVLCNLSSVESLRLRILLVCLHIIVILIIITYSEWTAVAARGQPPVRAEPWPAVLVHATRLVRNLSSAGTRARQELRDEKDLIDCLVWIVRVGVKSEQYDNKCLEHSVCTLRNLSYRLESEIDRDRYDDADVDVDPAAVKEQQSQGCFAGCGGRKKKKVPNDKRPMDRPRGPPQGVELIWQPETVQQYYVLLRKAKNIETLEGSAGALHNLTACSWKWAIKIRGDTRRAQAIQQLVELLRIDYDPTIRAAAIALRNMCVDSENKKIVGEKAVLHLVHRLPTGEEEERLVQDPTVASLLCAIYQITNKNDKNAKYLRKTKGIQKIVRIATDQNRVYSPRVIKIANQVLANLWSHSQLQQQMKNEGWQYDAELARAPMDFEATSLPRTPDERSRRDPNIRRMESDDDQWRNGSRRARDQWDGEPSGVTDISSESDRQRSWGESLNNIPPPYTSDDNYSRGSRSRDDLPMEVMSSSPRPSASNSVRDENENSSDRTFKLNGSGGGGGGGKNEDLWV
ncbi:lipoxygenase homology domain-containing protein 1 isoform X1 [Pocillopora verrucosa]|uniref:lipoxygenase homology domain-containing protein 1 isoform X1 n=1 Tax=Pocillopora verrucosa TaxID=203993 RepID=UPI00333EA8E5